MQPLAQVADTVHYVDGSSAHLAAIVVRVQRDGSLDLHVYSDSSAHVSLKRAVAYDGGCSVGTWHDRNLIHTEAAEHAIQRY